MTDFNTQKLFELIEILKPKQNFLFLNDPEQNSKFLENIKASGDENYDLVKDTFEDFENSLIALVTRDDEIEIINGLIAAIPAAVKFFGKPITDNDVYHCRIVFINIPQQSIYGLLLGRKTRVYTRGPLGADGTDLDGGLSAFTEIDVSHAVENITQLLAEAGSAVNELAYGNWDDDDEIEELEGQIDIALSNLDDYLTLEIDDIDNDNH